MTRLLQCSKGYDSIIQKDFPLVECVDGERPVVEGFLLGDGCVGRCRTEVFTKQEEKMIQDSFSESTCTNKSGVVCANDEGGSALVQKPIVERLSIWPLKW